LDSDEQTLRDNITKVTHSLQCTASVQCADFRYEGPTDPQEFAGYAQGRLFRNDTPLARLAAQNEPNATQPTQSPLEEDTARQQEAFARDCCMICTFIQPMSNEDLQNCVAKILILEDQDTVLLKITNRECLECIASYKGMMENIAPPPLINPSTKEGREALCALWTAYHVGTPEKRAEIELNVSTTFEFLALECPATAVANSECPVPIGAHAIACTGTGTSAASAATTSESSDANTAAVTATF
jgi:hypothetical protein